jgi:DNA invertase Pin-like site-specific DNA recombinase
MAERAVIYLRVSGTSQEDGSSLGSQEKDCRQYAARQGYTIVDVITEVETGVDSDEWRPGLQQVKAILQRGEADILLVWKFDRMNRGAVGNLILHRLVRRTNTWLESTLEGRIPNSRQGENQLYMLGNASEAEAEAIVLRTRRGLAERVGDSMPLVGKYQPFGYRYTYGPGRRIGTQRKVGLEIEEETAAIVRRCYEAIDAGMSLNRLGHLLNQENVPTPTQWLGAHGLLKPGAEVAIRWSRKTLRRLLTKPTYYGHHVVYREKQVTIGKDANGKPRHSMRLREEGDAQCVVLSVPAIVDEGLWRRVQAAMSARKADSPRRNSDPESSLLRAGFAYCGHCGAKMLAVKHHSGRMYICPKRKTARVDIKPTCPGGTYYLSAKLVDADVWGKVEAIIRDTPRLRKLVEARRGSNEEARETAERDAVNVQAEIADYEKRQALVRRRLATEEDDTIYAVLREELKQQEAALAQLRKRSRGAATRVAVLDAVISNMDTLIAKAQGAGGTYREEDDEGYIEVRMVGDSPSYAEKRQFLSLLGVRVLTYASNSDEARREGKRWKFTFAVDDDSDTLCT